MQEKFIKFLKSNSNPLMESVAVAYSLIFENISDVKLANLLQSDEIQKHKWIESEKVGYDVGDQASIDWIRNHAKEFRSWWSSLNQEQKDFYYSKYTEEHPM